MPFLKRGPHRGAVDVVKEAPLGVSQGAEHLLLTDCALSRPAPPTPRRDIRGVP